MNIAGGRYSSHSPPTRIHGRDEGSMARNAMVNSNNRSSPRGGRLPLLGGHDDDVDVDGSMKRRRLDEGPAMHGRSADPYRAAAEADYAAEEEYRRSRAGGAGSGGGPSPRNGSNLYAGHDDRYGGSGPPSAERRSIGDESFDSTVPLARRRGDAAQAKASRLHIDTGYGEGGHQGGMHDMSRNRLPPYQLPTHGARSAPAHKVSFSERDGPPFDPRGEPPPRGYMAPGEAVAAPGAQLPPVYGRREALEQGGVTHERNNALIDRRREPGPGQGPSAMAGYRGGPGPTAATPLTATRNVFMPQTATLPSPAYHTTQFVRQTGGGAPPSTATAAGANATSGLAAPSTAANHAGGPRTAGLNPPMTARLPEHLRSPPSNKTQFLSLFSNFYDSLQDSRTLKATLEDQVRRSNTLLQTLQRSARVLELTVERRLVAERGVWESKVNALEERCRRLEQKTGAGSPTPSPEGGADEGEGRSSSNGNAHTGEDVEKGEDKDVDVDVDVDGDERNDAQSKAGDSPQDVDDEADKADGEKKRRKKA